jgi:hypothetical protein
VSKGKERRKKNTQDKRKEKLGRKEMHACEEKSNVHKGKRGKGNA